MEENNLIRKKEIPKKLMDIEKWEVNRRKFIRGALLAGAMTQISFFTSCSTQLEKGNDLLSPEQATILTDVLNIFFPDDGNGPSARDINTFGYIMWVLHDSLNRKSEENQYIIDGLGWTNETAQEVYVTKFIDLDQKQKEEVIAKVTQLKWGRSWSSMLVTLIMEALLLDPLYGGNTDEKGWKWLNHTPGYPRPTEELRYERIMEKQMKLK